MLKEGFTALFVFFLLFVVVYAFYFDRTRKGFQVTIRRIAGLDAIDEAVGRCTEMGRPVHYTFGIGVFDTNVLASFNVLAYTAEQCARMDTDIIVTNALPEVHPITEEIVRGAYSEAGKIDAYKPDNIRFLSRAQTAYIAAIFGIFKRERPGANIMLGPFFAESLMLGEVGNHIGAIQIGGTGRTIQVPFFVASCDYTLIGDELFAAGAYIKRQPAQIGALMAQDFGKWAAIALIIVGTILATMGSPLITDLLQAN